MPRHEEIDFEDFVSTHISMIVVIGGSFLLWMIVDFFWPDFFNPSGLLIRTNDILGAVAEIWPFFLYGLIMAFISLTEVTEIYKKETILVKDAYLSVMAGILEEVLYRCLFIFTSMVLIAILDLITFGLMLWLYRNLVFPIADILTLGLMHGTIYGPPVLFMAGGLSANAAFRDGHKYQGLYGYISSWFVGMYLLYMMLTYGLVIAILAHMIYDLTFALVRYGGRSLMS